MAEEGLDKGVNFGVLNVLERLRQKDPESAKKLAGEVVEKLQSQNLSADGEASVVEVVFLAAVVFFAVVFLPVAPSCVVVAVLEVEAVSCFCAQEVTNAMPIKAVIKDKTDFFIGFSYA